MCERPQTIRYQGQASRASVNVPKEDNGDKGVAATTSDLVKTHLDFRFGLGSRGGGRRCRRLWQRHWRRWGRGRRCSAPNDPTWAPELIEVAAAAASESRAAKAS